MRQACWLTSGHHALLPLPKYSVDQRYRVEQVCLSRAAVESLHTQAAPSDRVSTLDNAAIQESGMLWSWSAHLQTCTRRAPKLYKRYASPRWLGKVCV